MTSEENLAKLEEKTKKKEDEAKKKQKRKTESYGQRKGKKELVSCHRNRLIGLMCRQEPKGNHRHKKCTENKQIMSPSGMDWTAILMHNICDCSVDTVDEKLPDAKETRHTRRKRGNCP